MALVGAEVQQANGVGQRVGHGFLDSGEARL
jgi:hypothetical protein